MTHAGWVGTITVAVALGCGGDDSGGGGGTTAGSGGGDAVSAAACHRQCEAQDALTECRPLVDLAACTLLCDQLAASLDPMCAGKFDAYYGCSADAGFTCLIGLPSQPTGTCAAEESAFTKCTGAATSCQGENERGVCPHVQCPCPEGTKSVSGFDSAGDGCRCFDETTCVDFFCGW